MKAPDVKLVCALADSPRVVPGSAFSHVCAECQRAVMIAPSGQRVLREVPAAIIICGPCYEATGRPLLVLPAAPIEELLDEVKRSRPNLRRRRN